MQETSIPFNASNKKSITKALSTFSESLRELYETQTPFDENYILLVKEENKRFSAKELLQDPNIQKCLELSAEYEADTSLKHTSTYAVASQCFLLQCALEEGLEKEVLSIVDELLAFVIQTNDTSSLWCDDMHVFGLELVCLLALFKGEYLYKVAHYITPNWDEEHAPYVLRNHMSFFIERLGFSKPVLKALANTHTYEYIAIFLFDEYYANNKKHLAFYNFLQNNPEAFSYFKREHLSYLKTFPRAKQNEDYIHLADEFFSTICTKEVYDKRQSEPFGALSLEESIDAFSEEIDAVLKEFNENDYVFLTEQECYESQEYEHDFLQECKRNYEFFLKGFENGEQILSYIWYGYDKEETLKSLTPIEDLKEFAREKNLDILKRFEYYGADEFDEMMEFFIDEQLETEPPKPSFMKRLFTKTQEDDPKERALRVLDVLFCICALDRLDKYSIDKVLNTYELCDNHSLTKRFRRQKSKEELIKEANGLMNPFLGEPLTREELNALEECYQEDPSIYKEVLVCMSSANSPLIDDDMRALIPDANISRPRGSYLLAVAFLLSKHYSRTDENTALFERYLQENFFKVFEYILRNSGITSCYVENEKIDQSYLIDDILSYCKGAVVKAPPKVLMKKVLTVGVQGLSKEEKEAFEAFKKPTSSISKEQAQKSIQKLYYYEQTHETYGIAQVQFSFEKTDLQGLLSSVLYMAKVLTPQAIQPYMRAFRLLVELAPVYCLHNMSKAYFSLSDLENERVYYNFSEELERLALPSVYNMAYLINRAIRGFNEEEGFLERKVELLAAEFGLKHKESTEQNSLIKRAEEKERADLKEVLNYLDNITKVGFLVKASKHHPCPEYRQVTKEIFDADLHFFARRLSPCEKPEWSFDAEEKEAFEKEVQKRFEILEAYIFQEESFERIETYILPDVKGHVNDRLDKSMWDLEDLHRERILYMLGRFAYLNRIYDYYNTFKEKEQASPEEMYELLLEVGLSQSFAFLFIVSICIKESRADLEEEDKEFIHAFLNIYPSLELFEVTKEYQENVLLFMLTNMHKDELSKKQIKPFLEHSKIKVKKLATRILA